MDMDEYNRNFGKPNAACRHLKILDINFEARSVSNKPVDL